MIDLAKYDKRTKEINELHPANRFDERNRLAIEYLKEWIDDKDEQCGAEAVCVAVNISRGFGAKL